MNKSQKSFIKSKSKVEKQYSIGKYLKILIPIQDFFRKIWEGILFFFDINKNTKDNYKYPFNEEPHNIYYYLRHISKGKNYCISFSNKVFKTVKYFRVHIIMLLVALFILINYNLELLIFIDSLEKKLSNPLSVINFIIIFFIVSGIVWWFTTPEGYTSGNFFLRTKEIILRLLFAVIVLSGIYFNISYPPLWFDELNITYDKQIIFFSNQTWLSIPKRFSSLHEPLNIRNILLGIFGIFSLIFIWWRNKIADKDLKLKERRRLDERFHEATKTLSDALDSKTYPSHIGGISTLTQLALDSKDQTQRCLDVICSCNEWMRPYVNKFKCNSMQKCYTEIEIFTEGSIVTDKPLNSKDVDDALISNPKWEEIVSLEEAKRSQKALNAVAEILQKISVSELQKDNDFIKLSELNFRSVMLCGINMRGLKLDGINLREACLNGADLRKANLNNANLEYAKLNWSYLEETNLENSNLNHAQLIKSFLYKANLSRVNMIEAELPGAVLSESILFGANIRNSNLQFADLQCALLYGVDLYSSKLQGANLAYAKLVGAHLLYTHLEGANMSRTNLQASLFYKANLLGANFEGADFSYSIVWDNNFYGTNLHFVFGFKYKVTRGRYTYFDNLQNDDTSPLIFSSMLVNNEKYNEKYFQDIIKNSPSHDESKQFMTCIRKALKLINDKVEPDLDILKAYSIIKQLEDGNFVMQSSELIIELQNRWYEWAKLHKSVAERLLSLKKVYLSGKTTNKTLNINYLVSQLVEGVYKKLKKTDRLKKAYKEISYKNRFN